MLLSEFDQKLLQEWDYEKNNKLNIFPDKITYRSGKKVWWKCNKNHSWQAIIYSRTGQNKTDCPYCAGNKLLKGLNDLLTVHPNLCKEWDYNKNNIRPDDIAKGSHKKVYWKCNKGHSWEATINSRTNGNKCPYCSNKKVLKGYNDLLSQFPDICKEWDYEKNNINPDEITLGSHKKVYWKCSKGHSWNTIVYRRTINKSGCPECKKGSSTSFGEQCIYYYLLPYNAKNRFKIDNMEIDVYLPKMNIGIEFNGEYWHKERKEKDLIKELNLSHKVKMYYIYESNKNIIQDNKFYFDCKHKYDINLELVLNKLFNTLNLNIDVNIERDKQLIYKNLIKDEKENSLAYKHPELAKEWDYDKNFISPEQIASKSGRKVYWKCKHNHSWVAAVCSRTNGRNCPYCSGRLAIKGENDLLSNFPDLCKEGNITGWWDYNKNLSEYGLKPDEVTYGSSKTVYWKCNTGHSWETKVYSRTSTGKSGCPYCAGKKVLKGYNDLQSKFPDIAKEWDDELNFSEYGLKSDEITKGAHKKVYWKCKNNHSWLASINSRIYMNSGCPYCAKKRSTVIQGEK